MNKNLSPLQVKLLEMFKWFHEFCEANNLRYYAIGGTMLGAARHQGFIPWDDDIDIGMPRKDYNQLCHLLFSHPLGHYLLEIPGQNSDFFYTFAKLYDTRTTLIENTKLKIKRGIYLDIFPLDGIGNTLQQAQRNFTPILWKLNLLIARVTGIRKGRTWYKNLVVHLLRSLPQSFLNDRSLLASIVHDFERLDFDQCAYVANLAGIKLRKEIMPRSFFGKPVLYSFENLHIWGVEHPHEYLTQIYGNWHQLPPLDKQKTHHDFLELNLYKSYLKSDSEEISN